MAYRFAMGQVIAHVFKTPSHPKPKNTMPDYPELDDQSPMPYGAHVNVKMEKVPARYLLWMWNDGVRHAIGETTKRGTVARYIKSRMAVLKEQDPDTIVNE